jgi:hypothetical protein
MSSKSLDSLEALVSEAENAFAGQLKALWSDHTYLSPKDARALRGLLTSLAERTPRGRDALASDPG